ncbi:hypothetical protein GCM10010315_57410 [Streptomyces luteosporeus]|uniref:PucR family transcriptional regulator n=1 Tax=Streptomyces luteosporeus TaxID=173856 RepID=A0ABN3UA96_9ACTN
MLVLGGPHLLSGLAVSPRPHTPPAGWSAVAAEDAAGAIGILVEALPALEPYSAQLLAPIRVTLAVQGPASVALEHLTAWLSADPAGREPA